MRATLTPHRAFLETDLLPRWAKAFGPDAVVLNIGAGSRPYREHFVCTMRTSDKRAEVGCDETFPVEAIPYPDGSVDGLLCVGVVERLDDPMHALRECRRVLKPGGTLLLGIAGIDGEWHAARDRWRLTPGGMAHLVQGFLVLEERQFGRTYAFYVVTPS